MEGKEKAAESGGSLYLSEKRQIVTRMTLGPKKLRQTHSEYDLFQSRKKAPFHRLLVYKLYYHFLIKFNIN